MKSDIDEVSDDGSTVWREVESEREESVVGDTADIHQVTTDDDLDLLIEQEESKDYFPPPTKIPFIPIEPPLSIQKPSAISPVNDDLQRLSEKIQSPGPKAVSSVPPFMKWRVVKKVKSFLTVTGVLLSLYLLDLLSNGLLRQSLSDFLQVTPSINLNITVPKVNTILDSTFDSSINQYDPLVESLLEGKEKEEERIVIEISNELMTSINNDNISNVQEVYTVEQEENANPGVEDNRSEDMRGTAEEPSNFNENMESLHISVLETVSLIEKCVGITADPSPETVEQSDLSSPSTIIISSVREDVDLTAPSSSILLPSEMTSAYKFVQPLLPIEENVISADNSSTELIDAPTPSALPSEEINPADDAISWNWILVVLFVVVVIAALAGFFYKAPSEVFIEESEPSIPPSLPQNELEVMPSATPQREEPEANFDALVRPGSGLRIQTNPPRQSEELYISPVTTNSVHDSPGSSPFNSTDFPNLIHASMINDSDLSNMKNTEETTLFNVNKTLYQPSTSNEEELSITGTRYFLRSSTRKNHPYYLRSDDDDHSVTSDITHNAIIRKAKAKANLAQPRTRRSAALK